MRYVVRLVPEDWRTYRDLRLEMVTDAPDAFWTTREQLEDYTEDDWRRRANDGTVQVREADGTPAGTPVGTLTVLTPRPDVEVGLDSHDALVLAVYVVPAARGTGVLELLLGAAEEIARTELGARRLVLHVHDRNARAITAYRRCGYRLTGATLQHPTEPGHRDVEMELPL